MLICPGCGNKQDESVPICETCGYHISGPVKIVDAVNNPENGSELDSTVSDQIDENDSKQGSKNKRELWIEQQKSLQAELSGLKSSLKDEIMQKPNVLDVHQFPLPNPYLYQNRYNPGFLHINPEPHGYRPEVPIEPEGYQPVQEEQTNDENRSAKDQNNSMTGKNEGNGQKGEEIAPVDNLPDKNTSDNGHNTGVTDPISKTLSGEEKTESETPIAVPVAGIPRKSIEPVESTKKNNEEPPKKVITSNHNISPNDLLKVETVISDAEESNRSRDFNLAGAINKVLGHEKMYHSRSMTLKLSAPPPIANKAEVGSEEDAGQEKEQVYEIITFINESLKSISDEFNNKPIRKLLKRAHKKLKSNDYEAALIIAHNAKTTFERLYEHYLEAKNRLEELKKTHPELMEPNHQMNNEYKQILYLMKIGQYFQLIKQITNIEMNLGEESKEEGVGEGKERPSTNVISGSNTTQIAGVPDNNSQTGKNSGKSIVWDEEHEGQNNTGITRQNISPKSTEIGSDHLDRERMKMRNKKRRWNRKKKKGHS